MSKKKSVAVRWRVPRRVPVLAAKTHLVPLWQACASGYTPRRAAEEFVGSRRSRRTYWEKPRQVVWNEDNAAPPKGVLGPAEPMTFRVRGGWRTYRVVLQRARDSTPALYQIGIDQAGDR